MLSLPSTVVGVRQVQARRRSLETFVAQMRQSALSGDAVESALPDSIYEIVEVNQIKASLENLEQLIMGLDDISHNAPRLTLTLAQEPDLIQTDKLVTWIRQELGGSILLDIKVQPSIIGGCLIRVGSKQFDGSYQTRLKSSQQGLVQALRST